MDRMGAFGGGGDGNQKISGRFGGVVMGTAAADSNPAVQQGKMKHCNPLKAASADIEKGESRSTRPGEKTRWAERGRKRILRRRIREFLTIQAGAQRE